MKINSTLFVVVVIMLVAAVSYYIGGSMQETNSIRQSIHTPITETEPFQKGVKELWQENWSAALTFFQKAIEKPFASRIKSLLMP